MKGTLTLDQIRVKVSLLRDYLRVFEIIDEGLTRYYLSIDKQPFKKNFYRWKGILLVKMMRMSMFIADQVFLNLSFIRLEIIFPSIGFIRGKD